MTKKKKQKKNSKSLIGMHMKRRDEMGHKRKESESKGLNLKDISVDLSKEDDASEDESVSSGNALSQVNAKKSVWDRLDKKTPVLPKANGIKNLPEIKNLNVYLHPKNSQVDYSREVDEGKNTN
jgi:hypothetical protein